MGGKNLVAQHVHPVPPPLFFKVPYLFTIESTAMKTVQLDELREATVMSQVLHLTLGELSRKLGLRAGLLATMLGLHSSDLTRMRLLHVRPQYARVVSRMALMRVLQYLFVQFPTMELGLTRRERLVVRLYKRRGGLRLMVPQGLPPSTKHVLQVRRAYRPGSTRWFLHQGTHEKATKDQQVQLSVG